MAATARTVNRNRTVGTGSRTRMANAGNGYYVQGNAVRRLDVTQEIVREPQKKISNTARKNRERAKHMSAGYVVFLCMALMATGIILVYYIGLQSDNTTSETNIST